MLQFHVKEFVIHQIKDECASTRDSHTRGGLVNSITWDIVILAA